MYVITIIGLSPVGREMRCAAACCTVGAAFARRRPWWSACAAWPRSERNTLDAGGGSLCPPLSMSIGGRLRPAIATEGAVWLAAWAAYVGADPIGGRRATLRPASGWGAGFGPPNAGASRSLAGSSYASHRDR